LPTTNQEVGRPADTAQIFLATPKRQHVDGVGDKGVVTIVLIGTVGRFWIISIVIAVVSVGVGISVAGQELQALRETLPHFYGQGFVLVVGAIAKVVAQVARTTQQRLSGVWIDITGIAKPVLVRAALIGHPQVSFYARSELAPAKQIIIPPALSVSQPRARSEGSPDRQDDRHHPS
jgi:hypothetical protein